jgi:hypothetical protein
MIERRAGRFTERLSLLMVIVAAIGGFFVLLDPRFTIPIGDVTLAIGGTGFSQELKGAVVTIMLIGGWTAVKEYWLGASAGAKDQSESMSRIAEAAAPIVTGSGVSPKTETMNVAAENVTVNEDKPK